MIVSNAGEREGLRGGTGRTSGGAASSIHCFKFWIDFGINLNFFWETLKLLQSNRIEILNISFWVASDDKIKQDEDVWVYSFGSSYYEFMWEEKTEEWVVWIDGAELDWIYGELIKLESGTEKEARNFICFRNGFWYTRRVDPFATCISICLVTKKEKEDAVQLVPDLLQDVKSSILGTRTGC